MISFDDDQLFQIILSSFIFFQIFYDECNQILCLSLRDNANFLTGTNKFWISFFISSPTQSKGKIQSEEKKSEIRNCLPIQLDIILQLLD